MERPGFSATNRSVVDLFGDAIDVILTVERTGATSLTYTWQVLLGDGTLCIDGRSVVVHVDHDGKPSPLSGQLLTGLSWEERPGRGR